MIEILDNLVAVAFAEKNYIRVIDRGTLKKMFQIPITIKNENIYTMKDIVMHSYKKYLFIKDSSHIYKIDVLT